MKRIIFTDTGGVGKTTILSTVARHVATFEYFPFALLCFISKDN